MSNVVYKHTHVYGEFADEVVARCVAQDHNVSLIEAYCLVKGYSVKTSTAKEVVETIKITIKRVTNKLRKTNTKRVYKTRKVVRTPGLVLFKAPEVVASNTSRLNKAKTILTRAVTFKEVLSLAPQDLYQGGVLLNDFKVLVKAYGVVKALMA